MSGKTLEQLEQEQRKEKVTETTLDNIDSDLAKLSSFVKVEAGTKRLMHFFPKEGLKVVEGDFQGQPTKRIHFPCVDVAAGPERKIFALSVKHSQQLLLLLKKGYDKIEVSRKGSGRNDTSYAFVPA